MDTSDPAVISTTTARRLLGVDERTLRRYLRRGLITGFKLPGINGHWRIDRATVEALRAGVNEGERR
jgi:excisionase family DNA binding protein